MSHSTLSGPNVETSTPVLEFMESGTSASPRPADSAEHSFAQNLSHPDRTHANRTHADSARANSTPDRRSFSSEMGEDDFSYRPVPIIAPVAFFLGISSVIGIFGPIGLVVGLVGVILGAVATVQIRRSPDVFSGLWMAVTGTALSAFFLVAGSTFHGVAYATEVPEGFERVNFTRDISLKGFEVEEGVPTIHPDVRHLDGKKVFLKGYMYPERQIDGIQRFVFVKDNGQCCFGGQPKMTDMILVEMEEGKTVEFLPYLVSVAGTFHARAPDSAGGLTTVYKLDASYFSPAKTSF